MIFIRNIFFFLILAQSTAVMACECLPDKNHDKYIEESFKTYRQIFIGEIIELDSIILIQVKEVFKGSLKEEQLINIGIEGHSCSYYFGEIGYGLFYGSVIENEFFTDVCSPSRMFDNPRLYPPPPPPLPGSTPDPEGERKKMIEYQKAEKEILEYEIEQLRKKTSANNK